MEVVGFRCAALALSDNRSAGALKHKGPPVATLPQWFFRRPTGHKPACAGQPTKKPPDIRLAVLLFVEVVGFESKIQTPSETLARMVSNAYICRRSFIAPSVFGIFLGYDL